GRLFQSTIQPGKRRNKWTDGKWQVTQHRSNQNSNKRKGQPATDGLFVKMSDRASWTQRQEKIKPNHSGWQDQRQRDHRLQQKVTSPSRASQPVGQRHAEHKQNGRGARRQF